MMVAVEHEWHEIVNKLIEIGGMDISNWESGHGNTALHIAAMKGDMISCKLLFACFPEAALM